MIVIVAGIVLFLASFSFTEPQWQMYGGDIRHSRVQLSSAEISSNNTAWKFHTDGWVYGVPCIGRNGTVYVGSWDGYVYAINGDGSLRWKWWIASKDSIWSSPALGNSDSSEDETVYIGGDNYLFAISDSSGVPEFKWSFATDGRIFASPTVGKKGIIYFGSLDGNFYAVSPKNGSLIWSFSTHCAIYSSAAISPKDGTIYFATFIGGKIYALSSKTGALKWLYTTKSGYPIPSSPSLSDDNSAVYIGSTDGNLYSLAADTGLLGWTVTVGIIDGSSTAVGTNGIVYLGSLDSHLYAISPSGEVLWKFRADSQVQSAPSIDARGIVYFSSFHSTLYAVYPNSTVFWSATLGGESFSSPSIGHEAVFVGSNDGNIYAFSNTMMRSGMAD